MAGDLTPWEDINPTTASAQRRERPSPSSEDRIIFRNELTACLSLVAPVGMTEESRRDWLAVAWDTLKHIPSDILESGARIARQKCDHPAKIVPTIIAETSERMSFRSRTSHWDQPQLPAPKVECVTPEEVAEILRSVGIKPAFASPKEGEDNG